MIKHVVLMVALWCATPTFGSEFTKAFSTTKFCTGFFVGLTPILIAQAIKKHAVAHSIYSYLPAAGSIASAFAFEFVGMGARLKYEDEKVTKRYGESLIAGFVVGLLGGPATLWFANQLE